MENQTSFDLNVAIQRWRENLAQSASFRAENLNELESHLRDSVARLQTGELSVEESFLIASRRIGGTQQLETEFGKLNRNSIWLDRLLWMLIGIQAWTIATGSIGSITSTLMTLGWSQMNYHPREQGMTLPMVVFAAVRLLSLGASIWLCWWVIFCKGGKLNQWLRLKLRSQFSFVAWSITASVLLLLIQAFVTLVPTFLRWRMPARMASETMMCMSLSNEIVHYALIISMIVFTLALARKRFHTRSV
jgi:hypothetical protein